MNSYPYCGDYMLEPPDYPEPPEIDYPGYVQDWINSELVEVSGQDIYAAPLERLTEGDWLVQLLAAQCDDELLTAAKVVRDKLYEFVSEQAEEVQP